MDAFCESLNDLLVTAFRDVLKLEEKTLRSMHSVGLSINEFHLIETIGKSESKRCTISEIAKELSLTLPSVTVAVNKLEKKGLLERSKGEEDGRTVFISLTELGVKVNRIHLRFHENMVRAIAAEMTEQEKDALLHGIAKLNRYFDQRLNEGPPAQLEGTNA